ncbi:hypothetical protein WMF38_05990 [Sorangium sp. So ce118]
MRQSQTTSAFSLLGLLPLLAGCADEKVTGPAVTVAIWDAMGGDEEKACYARCKDSAPLDAAIAEEVGRACPEAADAEGRDCSFDQGGDRIRITADYGPIAFDNCDSVAIPTLTVMLDDGGAIPVTGLEHGCQKSGRYFAQKEMLTPVTRSADIRFRVASGTGYFTDTGSFPLRRPTVSLDLDPCDALDPPGPQDCALMAGVQTTTVTVSVPAGVTAETALVTWDTSGTAITQKAVPLSVYGESKSGRFDLPMPEQPGRPLSIVAQVGDLAPQERSILLDTPAPLVMQMKKGVVTPDFQGALAPSSLTTDPAPECRTFTVGVRAPDGAPGNRVTIEASQGTLDSVGAKVQRDLSTDASNHVTNARLVLPASPTSSLVQLVASSGAMTAAHEIPFSPIWPASASLTVASPAIVVSASGSAATSIKGFALAPKIGATFLPDTRLHVVVTATPTADPVVLPCGALTRPEDLQCEPTKPGQLPGGCLLAPMTVTVASNGEFTIPINGGVCFAGVVTVDVFAPTYTDSATCLGDRSVSSTPVRLTHGPALSLAYGP